MCETEEESGSDHATYLLEKTKDIIQTPDYCIFLDIDSLDQDNLWIMSSLRGMARVDLRVQTGVKSLDQGKAGGLIPDSYSIARHLRSRCSRRPKDRAYLPAMPGLDSRRGTWTRVALR